MTAPHLIAFDADDTLWSNQPHFDQVEARLLDIMAAFGEPARITEQLNAVQRQNMKLFGYGAKSFMLSMIETAIQLTDSQVTGIEIQQILDMGKELLRYPIEPLPGVVEVLTELRRRGHRLMVLTKGDLFDQESKLARSGLGDFFDYVEIVSEKDEATYRRLLARYNALPGEFFMIGNSLKSDILPVAQLGFRAVHVPFHATWVFEHVDPEKLEGLDFHAVTDLRQVLELI
ncbi:HAD family hydrolase [Hymenobacter chitinivorans]|uniref:Putative hydrolase of the HAD superfamily n=1 Tax=Hymenobacter chitinivorans DSM 11115 TaxID=1121954 RepID=A0A2M9BRR0_9BACT|nr:HAD family hydrolase [Hymenobacter chitinivorans]PJJ60627.1 putative hydrolase of the HAD superfamily [Hymenobacter chitinivorans DSM 11115]